MVPGLALALCPGRPSLAMGTAKHALMLRIEANFPSCHLPLEASGTTVGKSLRNFTRKQPGGVPTRLAHALREGALSYGQDLL